MIPGFEKIVEERIRQAQKGGEFENLPGTGEPLKFDEMDHVPEELRLAYKLLKNADMLPLELQLKNEILRTEDLLAAMPDTAEKYRLMKKLNFLILRLNSMRAGSVEFELPQHYSVRLMEKMEQHRPDGKPSP